ncbi:MAG: tetratricopeptide repeat protein [Pseudoflavonifractor sp.]|nr:tetratricopeptide repeat protein [Alloprevotella sp.]MCM1116504.1 tetratricopeptide repeat protein [Pseudoflavonifractor sp.]
MQPLPTSLLIMALASMHLPLVAQDFNPVSDDIIATYTELIAKKPSSYDLYLSRATEYLSQGLTAPALSDLNEALRLVPKGEKEARFEILSQRASLYEMQMDYEAALADLVAAGEIIPGVPSVLMAKGRVLSELERYPEAMEAFNRVRRANPHDADAIFGLANAAALNGDSDMALKYAAEGVALDPGSSSSYITQAKIYEALGRDDEVIAQYIAAIGCNDKGAAEAMQALANLSYKGYHKMMTALEKAITDNPTSGTLRYLRATISQAHCHHASALADFNMINGAGPFADGSLGMFIAESEIALGHYDEALKALDALPSYMVNSEAATLRARALYLMGHNDEAIAAAQRAVDDNQNPDAFFALGCALITAGHNEEASAAFASAIMLEPSNRPEAYFLRAPLVSEAQRRVLMEQALDLPFDPADPASLRGFALLASDRKEEALIWANSMMRFDAARDGVTHFMAACLLAHAQEPEKAREALSMAIRLGYDEGLTVADDKAPFFQRSLMTLPGYADIVLSNLKPVTPIQ